jgi:hypothetical protein
MAEREWRIGDEELARDYRQAVHNDAVWSAGESARDRRPDEIVVDDDMEKSTRRGKKSERFSRVRDIVKGQREVEDVGSMLREKSDEPLEIHTIAMRAGVVVKNFEEGRGGGRAQLLLELGRYRGAEERELRLHGRNSQIFKCDSKSLADIQKLEAEENRRKKGAVCDFDSSSSRSEMWCTSGETVFRVGSSASPS